MPTLTDVTEQHSKRISGITHRRDARLRDAVDARDRILRSIAACGRFYQAFDDGVASALAKRRATDARAEAARSAAFQNNGDQLADALAAAQAARRDADAAAFEKRRQVEADAEHEFILALAAGPAGPSTEAQQLRAEKLERARRQFDEARAAAQEQFRHARDAALIAESRGSRDAERAFATAARVNEASANSERAAAEQTLARALARIPEAIGEFEVWRKQTATILADYKREEAEEFERFHREMEALRL